MASIGRQTVPTSTLADVGNKLAGTSWGKLLQSMWSAAQLPGDVLMGRQQVFDPVTNAPDTGAVDRAADLAGTVTLGAGAMPKPQGAFAMGIKAYHGSPHDFERFDLSKIGTGEGAQAYGHGLYFADNEAVARSYRDALNPGNDLAYTVNGQKVASGRSLDMKDPYQRAVQLIGGNGYDDAVRALEASKHPLSPAILDEVRKLKGADVKEEKVPLGRMYEVQINADPEHFLDWDKPWAQQPDNVKNAIWQQWEKAGGTREGRTLPPFSARDDAPIESILAAMQTSGKKTGEAEAALRDAGIPGIKYLDAGSRAAGDGSRNYVVFDDKLISILRKYGWVPGAAIPAAAMQEYQASQQTPRNLTFGSPRT